MSSVCRNKSRTKKGRKEGIEKKEERRADGRGKSTSTERGGTMVKTGEGGGRVWCEEVKYAISEKGRLNHVQDTTHGKRRSK